jgi:manganese/zinc/iron transport system substrate-binding protein
MTLNARTPISRRNLIASALITVGAVAAGVGFTNNPAASGDGQRPTVTATIGMITDVARNIGGDHIRVNGLMGPGIDPHLYKPSAGDIIQLGNADLILYGGLHLEGRMSETFEKISESGRKPTVAVSESIPEEQLIVVGEGPTWDPHVWFDVSLWRIVAETIAESLIEMFPAHADTFAENAERYLAKLDELDAWVFAQVERLPESQRVVVTAHDAFSYFGRRYGFEVRGLQGLSTASEAGAGDVQELADFLAEREIRAMLVESSVPPATIEAVQAASRARGWDVAIGGELYADAMGEEGTADGTYIGMVRHNVTTIVTALLGDGETLAASMEIV